MKTLFFALIVIITSCSAEKLPVLETGLVTPMPREWIDKDTGHKIIHLTGREGDNRSFYFHNNPFLPAVEGVNEKMIFYGRVNNASQLFSVDLKTGETNQITNKQKVSGEIVARNNRLVYYQCGDSVFETSVETLKTRLIYVFPDSILGHITTLNADETLLAGAINSPQEAEIFRRFPEKRDFFDRVYEAKLLRKLFIMDVRNGSLTEIYSENAWLNHIQFSPTNPDLLMFCHEGPWHKVDRIWTININESIPNLIHKRSVDCEIAGHEFFSRDGEKIWFDLQIPRGETFFLSGANLETGEQTRYEIERDEWSIHFNISPDQKFFAGDGGDPGQVAKAINGMWIYLFKPDRNRLKSEKLVNMKHHNYKLEPNVHFSPDGKLVVFRANFEGLSDIYAVEIKSSE